MKTGYKIAGIAGFALTLYWFFSKKKEPEIIDVVEEEKKLETSSAIGHPSRIGIASRTPSMLPQLLEYPFQATYHLGYGLTTLDRAVPPTYPPYIIRKGECVTFTGYATNFHGAPGNFFIIDNRYYIPVSAWNRFTAGCVIHKPMDDLIHGVKMTGTQI